VDSALKFNPNGVMNLNNSFNIMNFTDSSRKILIEFDVRPVFYYPNELHTRNPDLTYGFGQHNGVRGTLFSP